MTKLDLQKELLEKVKPGIKPSDLKKKPLLKDEGYESDKSDKSIPAVPPFKPASEQDKSLPNQNDQISSLKKRLQTYQDFKDADLKIKEKLKEELAEKDKTISQLKGNIERLQNQNTELSKIIGELKNPVKPTEKPQPTENKTFLCSDCNQEKSQAELSRVFGKFSFCLTCSKQARKQAQQEKAKPEEFICHACQQTCPETPTKMKLDSTLTEYPICSPCKPTLKEFNEADLITDDLWAKYPYSSASEILEREFGIKKEETW